MPLIKSGAAINLHTRLVGSNKTHTVCVGNYLSAYSFIHCPAVFPPPVELPAVKVKQRYFKKVKFWTQIGNY